MLLIALGGKISFQFSAIVGIKPLGYVTPDSREQTRANAMPRAPRARRRRILFLGEWARYRTECLSILHSIWETDLNKCVEAWLTFLVISDAVCPELRHLVATGTKRKLVPSSTSRANFPCEMSCQNGIDMQSTGRYFSLWIILTVAFTK